MTDIVDTSAEVASPHRWKDPISAWRVLLGVYLVAIVIFLCLLCTELLTWAVYANTLTITPEVGRQIDQGVQVLNAVVTPAFLVCAAMTLWLTYRLVANVQSNGKRDGLPGPALATAYYVIPVICLIMPPIILGRVWRATFVGPEGREPRGLIGAWWSLYLITNFTGAFLMNSAPATSEELLRVLPISVLAIFSRAGAATPLLVIFGTLVKQQRHALAAEAFA